MLKKFKKLSIPVVALLGMLVLLTPPQASARVRFGISIGGPVYTAPVAPYSYGYAYPPDYYDYQGYYPAYPQTYNYVVPAAPYGGYYSNGYYGRGREHWEHERHEQRERMEHRYREHRR